MFTHDSVPEKEEQDAFFEHFESSSAESMRKTASSWRATKRRSVAGGWWEFGPEGAAPVVTGMDVAVFERGKIHVLYPFSRKPRAVGAESRLTLKTMNTPKHEARGRSIHLGNAEQERPLQEARCNVAAPHLRPVSNSQTQAEGI
jgi:hypothetical protein